MNNTDKNLYLRTIGLAAMTGMRTASSPAFLSYHAIRKLQRFRGTLFAPLTFRPFFPLFVLAELYELIADKMPNIGNRTDPAGFTLRIMSGAFVGAAAFTEGRRPILAGAALGIFTTVISTLAAFNIRRTLTHKLHLPDLPVALGEDATTLLVGLIVLRSYETK